MKRMTRDIFLHYLCSGWKFCFSVINCQHVAGVLFVFSYFWKFIHASGCVLIHLSFCNFCEVDIDIDFFICIVIIVNCHCPGLMYALSFWIYFMGQLLISCVLGWLEALICEIISVTTHKHDNILNHQQLPLFVQQLFQANNKENIKALYYWPFVRETTSH